MSPRMNHQRKENQMPNFKNRHFVLSYINQNPGCKVIEVRKALATRNGKLNNHVLPYTWYFSSNVPSWGTRGYGPKKGYDYGYWVNLSKGSGSSCLQLTQAGLQKLNSLQGS